MYFHFFISVCWISQSTAQGCKVKDSGTGCAGREERGGNEGCNNDGVLLFSDAASLVTRGTKNVKHFQTMCRVLCYIPSG